MFGVAVVGAAASVTIYTSASQNVADQ